MQEKTCTKCQILKPISLFYIRRDRNKALTECKDCFKARMGNRHQKHKDILVAELGGKCTRCNYAVSSRVLTFHHLDPSEKEFGISQRASASLDALREECKKCILLCPNCHAEKHLGLW